MQLTQATFRLEAAVEAQLRMGAAELVAVGAELLEVLRPAVRQAMMDVVEMASPAQVTGAPVGHLAVHTVRGHRCHPRWLPSG